MKYVSELTSYEIFLRGVNFCHYMEDEFKKTIKIEKKRSQRRSTATNLNGSFNILSFSRNSKPQQEVLTSLD